jgi:hypothetical protein
LRHVPGGVAGRAIFGGRTRATALSGVCAPVGSQVTGGETTTAPESVALDAQIASIRTMLAAGQQPPAGQLLGLPDLDDDLWADIAGAAAITGALPRTITGWLNRRGPKRCPFPEPRRSLYRLYWPVSVLQSWRDDYAGGAGQILLSGCRRE